MYLDWAKCAGGMWCPLTYIELREIHANGVYVIWRPSGTPDRPSTVIFVGQGDIAAELRVRREDPQMVGLAGLLVTWAAVDRRFVDGVAAYLIGQLRPLLGGMRAAAIPREVNLPISA